MTPGTRLGIYEITAPIGEGGMGQVWRATDTTLGRQVAIKILPGAFAADPERLARLAREARTLAALNHPHIAAIYGFEAFRSGGSSDPPLRALVMELVEGEDLSQRVGRGAIPLDEALPIAKQIAEALEAAHEQGIIHRDLKPANIKVRPDGTVKVLDFGLAKALAAVPGGRDFSPADPLANSPTITTPAMPFDWRSGHPEHGRGVTQAGMILGTAAYMAPEQATGKPLDRRADVWAFGAVLFELLTGQRAFPGEDVTDTIVSVLRKEPDWSALPANTPASMRTLLRRCLEKDRQRRLTDAGAARLEIEDALGAPVRGDAAPPAVGPRSPGRLSTWSRVAVLAMAAAVIVSLGVPAGRHLRETPPPEMRLEIVTPATYELTSFALSPDGRYIAFVASDEREPRLWLRALAVSTAQPLAGTENAAFPFWSPDSRTVGFFAQGKLKRVDIGGGAPQTLATAVPRGGSWNTDGAILFAVTTGGPLFRVPASGGEAVAVTSLDRQASHRFPFFLPDGRHFVFLAQGAPDAAGIYLGSLDSARTRRLTAADSAAAYLSSGWLLWARASTLVAQRLDLEQQALTGDPVIVADAVTADASGGSAGGGAGDGPASVSATGLVAFRTGVPSRRQLAWVDRSGTVLSLLGGQVEGDLLHPSISPDGQRVASVRSVQGNFDVWLQDGARLSRLTFDAALDRFPLWSADGRRIVFESSRKGHRDLYQTSASGVGPEESLVESQQDKMPTDRSADGRFLMYQSTDPQTDRDIWVMPFDGDRVPRVFLKTGFSERQGTFSPDGRWVAYMSNESGRDEVYIRPFAESAVAPARDGSEGQRQVSIEGGIHPRWRADGRELYYLRPNGDMMAAPIVPTGTTLAPGTPVALFPSRISGGGRDNQQGRQYDVAPDGRFLINTVVDQQTAPITLLQNWHPEARQ